MLSSLVRGIFGTTSDREVRRLQPIVEAVRRQESRVASLTNDGLRAETGRLREKLGQGASLDEILPEAFAAVREAAKRVAGMRPFDVQIIGGVVLHQGNIAEMLTGEGKTLVATMPLYLNALGGKGAHLVTVNDYLARRDANWMGPIFEFLGLTVGLIQHDMYTAERQVAYRADITYGTNSEFGFDYLRDNMARHPQFRVQRELNYAIVDEVDSILIDEARTPLIISGRPEKSTDVYYKVDEAVRKLRKETHYETDEKGRHVLLTEEGMTTVERLLGVENLYSNETLGLVHMVEQSLKAHNYYKKDDEYVVRNGQVIIVDEFTGRMMEGRRFGDGLHQAIEAKERVPVQFESQTIASITYQNFFKLYAKLAGMTGTAATEANEFANIYKLEVVQVPTNLPLVREDKTDLIFSTESGKLKYVVDEIEAIHKTGRPILVGTVSIEKSERLAKLLDARGIDGYQVLNAKQHEREAAIVANAGKRGAITIATNMAGRGTDIKLAEGIRELGGLAIVGTERHESRRIDNQLRGRSGRQGDPGTTRFYVSLEDEVARLFGGNRIKWLIDKFAGEQLDAEPLDQRMVSRSIERSQRQVEEYNFEIRKHLLEYDDVMNKQRQVIYQIRRDVLEDRDVTDRLQDMIRGVIAAAVEQYTPDDVDDTEWDIDGLITRLRLAFGFEPHIPEESRGRSESIEDAVFDSVLAEYARREKSIEDLLRQSYREQIGGDDAHVDFPGLARKRMHALELMVLLRTVDDKWIDHLYSMDYLRDSVRLRAMGQRDPLLEYKREGFELFEELMDSIGEDVVHTLFRVSDPELRRSRDLPPGPGAAPEKDPMADLNQYHYIAADKEQDQSFASHDTSRFNLAGQSGQTQTASAVQTQVEERPKAQPVRRTEPKVKPNDPCPCGSGKKYKKCCGAGS